jgi:hypothetical protein
MPGVQHGEVKPFQRQKLQVQYFKDVISKDKGLQLDPLAFDYL